MVILGAGENLGPGGVAEHLPAAATLLLGVIAGRFMLVATMDAHRILLLAAAGATLIVFGLLLDAYFMPINKSLWDAFLRGVHGGGTAIALAACYQLADGAGALRRWTRAALLPFVMFWRQRAGDIRAIGLDRSPLGTVKVVADAGQQVTVKHWLFGELSRLPLAAVTPHCSMRSCLFSACSRSPGCSGGADHSEGLTVLRDLPDGVG